MPAAIPSILIIFMELVSNYRVAHRLSFVVSKAISNSGRMKLGYGPFEAVAPVLVAAEHVKAREARAEQHVSPRLGGRGSAANRFVERVAHRVGDAARLECRGKRRAGLADEQGVRNPRSDPSGEASQVAPF
jgi:hypothetical protein